jgi:hypothetical protein
MTQVVQTGYCQTVIPICHADFNRHVSNQGLQTSSKLENHCAHLSLIQEPEMRVKTTL